MATFQLFSHVLSYSSCPLEYGIFWRLLIVGELACSAAHGELPPNSLGKINATYSTPLPLKVWVMDHNIGKTWELVVNADSQAPPQTHG